MLDGVFIWEVECWRYKPAYIYSLEIYWHNQTQEIIKRILKRILIDAIVENLLHR